LKGIKGGNDEGGGKGLMASEARSGRRGERWRGGFTTGVGRHGEEHGADKRGPVVRETRRRRPAREGVNRRGKQISHEDATDTRAGWPGRAILAYGDGTAGPKIRKKKFPN
jgi:hypothetical protein